MSDLDVLRRDLPPLPDQTLTPAEHAAHRARLLRSLPSPRRPKPWALALGPAFLAVLGVGALVLGLTHVSAPPATTPRSDAAVLLDRLASAAETRDVTPPRADQFVYVRSLNRGNVGRFGGPVRMDGGHDRRVWFSQDPSADGSGDDVIREFGQDWPIDYGREPAGLDRPTYAWLAALPTDPDALLDLLERSVEPGDGQEIEQAVFDRIGDLLAETLLPGDSAAALYRAAARIPGVRIERDAVDEAGRQGVALVRDDRRYAERVEWIFDASRLTFLGSRRYQLAGAERRPVLYSSIAVLERAVVDRVGEAPGD